MKNSKNYEETTDIVKWNDLIKDDNEPSCFVEMAYENYKKHHDYYPSGVLISCRCKKCIPYFYIRRYYDK